ncbi:hypothetical protein [Nostoc sp. CMAA1605]|nr:hypothetical protein [Nostoc sp. CMAA1605]
MLAGIGDWGAGGAGGAGEEKLHSLLITHYSLLITQHSALSTHSPVPN